MNVAEFIAQKCKELNEHTFLFVGGGNMYLADAIGRTNNYICMHHEQALSMAAEAYARITNKPSVCVVTTGPGGINAMNGVAGAWLDSIPMIVISGQVRIPMMKTPGMRQLGDQELPITEIVKPITKMAEVLTDVNDIGRMWDRAVETATSGRPGPVWLDIPLDIQNAKLPEQTEHIPYLNSYQFNRSYFDAILSSKRPLILAGNGIRLAGAVSKFRTLIEKMNIPVALSEHAIDLLPTSHYLNLGPFGMCGHQMTNKVVQKADVILILGCRMNVRLTGYEFKKFAKNAFKIMVDADETELNKSTFVPQLKVKADVGFIIDNLLKAYHGHLADWVGEVNEELKVTPIIKNIVQISEAMAGEENVIVSSNGVIPTYLNRYIRLNEGDRYIANSGLGSMGYALPASIGAALASGKRTLCFEGDGSLQLNVQELQTVKDLNLNLKIFVVSNGGYASVKATQDNYFKGNYVGRGPESKLNFPNIRRLAEAYQIAYAPFPVGFDDPAPVIYEIQANDTELPYKGTYE